MSNFNNINVSEIRNYLPGAISMEIKPKPLEIPVVSEASAKIFSNIRECIPGTKEKFSNVKRIDISAKEITGLIKKLTNLKSNENLHKIGSIVTTVSLAALSISLLITGIVFFVLVPSASPFVVALNNLLKGIVALMGCGFAAGGVIPCAIWIYEALTRVPHTQKKISALSEEAEYNHEKLKAYFTINYININNRIKIDIEHKKQDLKQLLGLHEDCKILKEKIENDLANFEHALVQLDNANEFYMSSKVETN